MQERAVPARDVGGSMAQAATGEYVFQLTGGRLCLDFANTLSGGRERPTERLIAYRDLVTWGRQAGVLSDGDARHLARVAAQHPHDAARTLAAAIALRETLYRIFSSVIDASGTAPADLAALNAALARAAARLRVVARADRFEWAWAADGEALDRVLWPVVRSAADLLVSEEVAKVRRCAGDTCDWLFLDTSRNHTRRWCDMRDCGNRAKARRYYARRKAGR